MKKKFEYIKKKHFVYNFFKQEFEKKFEFYPRIER